MILWPGPGGSELLFAMDDMSPTILDILELEKRSLAEGELPFSCFTNLTGGITHLKKNLMNVLLALDAEGT